MVRLPWLRCLRAERRSVRDGSSLHRASPSTTAQAMWSSSGPRVPERRWSAGSSPPLPLRAVECPPVEGFGGWRLRRILEFLADDIWDAVDPPPPRELEDALRVDDLLFFANIVDVTVSLQWGCVGVLVDMRTSEYVMHGKAALIVARGATSLWWRDPMKSQRSTVLGQPFSTHSVREVGGRLEVTCTTGLVNGTDFGVVADGVDYFLFDVPSISEVLPPFGSPGEVGLDVVLADLPRWGTPVTVIEASRRRAGGSAGDDPR